MSKKGREKIVQVSVTFAREIFIPIFHFQIIPRINHQQRRIRLQKLINLILLSLQIIFTQIKQTLNSLHK